MTAFLLGYGMRRERILAARRSADTGRPDDALDRRRRAPLTQRRRGARNGSGTASSRAVAEAA